MLKHLRGGHRAREEPSSVCPHLSVPTQDKASYAFGPGTWRAVLDVSRRMSMKQAFKPVTPTPPRLLECVPRAGKHAVLRQCLRGPVVVWGWALVTPSRTACGFPRTSLLRKGLFQPLLPPSFPAAKSPLIFKFVGPGNSRGIAGVELLDRDGTCSFLPWD